MRPRWGEEISWSDLIMDRPSESKNHEIEDVETEASSQREATSNS